jgi:hypothetical protein
VEEEPREAEEEEEAGRSSYVLDLTPNFRFRFGIKRSFSRFSTFADLPLPFPAIPTSSGLDEDEDA